MDSDSYSAMELVDFIGTIDSKINTLESYGKSVASLLAVTNYIAKGVGAYIFVT